MGRSPSQATKDRVNSTVIWNYPTRKKHKQVQHFDSKIKIIFVSREINSHGFYIQDGYNKKT